MTPPAMIHPAMFNLASTAFNLNAIAQTSAVQIVNCLVEGTLIAIFAGLGLRVVRQQNAGTRFAVWFAVLVAIAALPFFDGAWGLHAVRAASESATRPPITLPAEWAVYLFSAWAVIAGWLLLRVGAGLWHLNVLRKSCVPVDMAALDPQLQQTLASNLAGSGATRQVTLYISERVHVPTAIGLMKPAIVIPGWVMQELSADELNQVVLHELAHLRRWDDWTNFAQKVVKALFFFHPAVWWIERRVSLEREMACDDAVIAETESPRAYAECLTHLAEKTFAQRSMALAQAALGRIRQTSLRVAQILDPNRPSNVGRAWKSAVALVAGFAMVCVLSVSRAPQLVAFSDHETSHVANPVIAGASTGAAFPNVPVSNALFKSQPVRIVPASLKAASLKARGVRRNLETYEAKALVKPAATARRAGSMVAQTNVRPTNVRLTKADVTAVAFTDTTFFVIVRDGQVGTADQPVYRIQLWHVMVLHPVVDPDSNKIPAKQI